ncbi:MAG TPA: VanZ family protein [Bacteroidales bacterium]|nr:VanZ family protein [Bacteroidales bacterium]
MKKARITLINFYLFTILLIVTPFLMLQNYLQNAIGRASRAAIEFDFFRIPYVVIIAIIVLILFFYFSRKILTKKKLLYLGFILVFVAIGQLTSDYYFGHHFYDLQHNWHYIAYGIFSFVAFRRFSIKPAPTHKILFRIFIMALAISVFDEFIQVYISSRVFDLSDCGKDLWGNMAGSVFVFFFLEDGKGFPNYRLRNKKLKEYYTNPFSLLCLEAVFAYIFLFVASQITDSAYKFNVIFITLIFFIIVFLLIHAGKNKIIRWVIRGGLFLLIIIVFTAARFGDSGIKFVRPGYLNYNGIPLFYFDYMIFPNGTFRTVDKKGSFNLRDKQKIENLGPDILLIGKGSKGQGGKGWNDILTNEMVYNTYKHKVYQVIKLPNRQACETYNRLKKQHKDVLFIIHNE